MERGDGHGGSERGGGERSGVAALGEHLCPFVAECEALELEWRLADLVPGVPVRLPNWNTGTDRFDFASQPRYYNSAAFSKPADFTLGAAGRNILPTPPLPYQDFAIQKNVSLSERLKLQLRCELEHAFNNAIRAAPNASAGSATFGQITVMMGNWGDPLSAQLSFKLWW